MRETFNSRLGFILVSAGCAIGLGNVWKFPYMCGAYGGAAFLLIYLFFLVVFGLPVLLCEFSVGRASRQSVARAFDVLTPGAKRWRFLKYVGVIGCHLLMMFYTMVCGWMIYYAFRMARGEFTGASPEAVAQGFAGMLSEPATMTFWMIVTCAAGYAVCFMGLRRGIERVTKWMMIALLVIMVVLAVHSVLMPGAEAGIVFYLKPDLDRLVASGVGTVVFAAMSQAFFTLSLGVGSMLIFGSYLGKDRSLLGESAWVTVLDTFVAFTAGLIVIPACFSSGVPPGAGPGLVLITLPNIFAGLPWGNAWGTLFFIFMSFAAISTVIAVFECLVAVYMECFGWTRQKSSIIGCALMIVLSMPCVLGFNLWSGFEPMGPGTGIMDLEDFILSNNLLPLGALGYVFYCTQKYGWGWNAFITEVNTGEGPKITKGVAALKFYMTYCLPTILVAVYIKGYYDFFSPKGSMVLCGWLGFAALCLVLVFYSAGFLAQKDR